jgi:DNA-directed RNA polymerase, mitochondrial
MKSARASSEQKTVERFEKREAWRAKSGGYGATAEFRAFFAPERISRLASYIREQLRARSDLTLVLRNIDPHQLALAAVASLTHSVITGRHDPGLTLDIGRAVQGELWAAKLLRDDKALHRRLSRISDPRKLARLARKAGYQRKDWSEEQVLKAGAWLLDCCLQAMPDVFETHREPRRGDVISIRPEAAELAAALREEAMWSHPVLVPCTSPPKPWTGWRAGGYWDERTRPSAAFVRDHHKETEQAIRAAFRDGSMKQHVDGVNALQSVPWRINEPVLEAVKRYSGRLRDAGKLKASDALLAEDIATAERLKGAPFYVPLNCDFRGRLNGIPHFNFYREDHVRGLFLFNRGLPLGDRQNLRWLQVHTATCGGFENMDKQSFAAREFWAIARRDLIERTARLESEEWLEADKPFAFYAACLELTAAWEHGPDYVTRLPISFDATCSGLQHLCAMTRSEEGELVNLRWKGDYQGFFATCSGLQQSEEGGALRWTGGIPGLIPPQDDQSADALQIEEVAGFTRPPQDIYAAVAERVADLVKHDDDLRDIKIDRDLVKRPVMTYCYGVTKHGVIDQIRGKLAELDQRLEWEKPGVMNQIRGELARRGQRLEWEPLKRLRDHVWDALAGTVPRAEEAREFLRRLARVLAKKGEPLQWTTPTGLPWANRYQKSKTKRVHSVLRGHRVQRTIADGYEPGIRSVKAANAVVANVVHALDASHLLRTVNACAAAGINDLVTVHDSFGCLAPQADQFARIVRDEFVRMYEECDPLAELRERALCSLGPLAPQLASVPERGAFDLREVSRSVYAFS